MKAVTKSLIFFSILFFYLTNFVVLVYAHCPLCTAATASLVAVSRWYGVDDLIFGTFIGGLVISTSFWFDRILRKKNKGEEYIKFQKAIIILTSIFLTLITFYFANLLGTGVPNYVIFGVDKLFIGFLVGSLMTLFSFSFSDWLRKNNGGKSYFPFQVIVITIAFLILTSYFYILFGLI
ncbi:MAG: hypothetical protein QXQ18_01605 [Candidatus Aenigmatarchaeota archaeon]